MAILYQHTQPGIVIIAVCLAMALLGAGIMWRTAEPPMILMPIICIAIGVIFHSLTVEIEGDELRWHFGPGLWSYQLALDEISSVAIVRNHWWNGFGVRMAQGFRLYNVSGLDAVELRLKSGEIRRIGTDDPQGLADALKQSGRIE